MLRQFNQKLYESLVKKCGAAVVGKSSVDEILKAAKRVRSADYVLSFDIKDGKADSKSTVTRANWLFILTNAACYWESPATPFPVPSGDWPKVGVNFENFVPSSPFNSKIEDFGTVPTSLVFGREDEEYIHEHFEEYKNLYYLLNQRFVISLDVKSSPTYYLRGSVILTGLEIDLNEV